MPAMKCQYCFQPLSCAGIGRVPKFCSASCKQAAYRLRKNDYVRQRISKAAKQMVTAALAEQRQNGSLSLRNVTGTGLTYTQTEWC